MKTLATALLIFSVTLAAGCGSSGPDNSPDGLVVQSIAAMNALVDGMEAGKTKEELASLDANLESVTKKLKDLRLTKTETEALIEKHKPELDKAGARMVTAMMGSMTSKIGGDMNEKMGQAMGDLNSSMQEGMQEMSKQMEEEMSKQMDQMKNLQDRMPIGK